MSNPTRTVLDPRAVRVIALIATGTDRRDIAAHLGIGERTVNWDIDRACRALLVRRNDRAALVNTAIREGVITLPALPPVAMGKHLLATLELIADGYTNAEIAAELTLSVDAVKSRIKCVLRTLNANGRAHAVAVGRQRGLQHTEQPAGR